MEILFIISIVSLVFSFLMDFIYNLIIMPVKKIMEKEHEGPHYVSEYDLKEYYNINKPMILKQIPILGIIIEKGGFLFFSVFVISFLIVVYSVKYSFVWTLLCIPGLAFLYFVMNLVSALLSRLLVR